MLKWFTPMRVGEGQEEFKDNASIGVQADLTNKSSIVLKFSKLEYIVVYLCIAYDNNNQPGNVARSSIRIEIPFVFWKKPLGIKIVGIFIVLWVAIYGPTVQKIA
jgi:hypothetical protein